MNLKKLDWLPLILARVVMGARFGEIGWGKLQFLPPHWSAHLFPGVIAILELVGGICLILGLRTRAAALALLIILCMHGLPHFSMVYREELFNLLSYAALLLGIIIQGPGILALNK